MEVSKKRKRDVDCPRITYYATTKVFDRLFKEESLEEMKNIVRKKLGLSASLPVHLSQLRDGKSVVLEDDDDFDAFYASVHSTPVAEIKVHFGGDQPAGTAGPDAGFSGGSMQLPTVHHATADDYSLWKKRKVSFVEPILEPLEDFVEEPEKIQQKVALDDSRQPSPNYKAPPMVPATIDVISADAEEAHETGGVTEKKTGNKKEKKKKGKAADPTLENQSFGGDVHVSENTPYDVTKSKKRPRTSISVQSVTEVLDGTTAPGIDDTGGRPGSSKKSKHKHKNPGDLENYVPDLINDNQAATRTKGLEESECHTPSDEQADPSEVDGLTWSPKEIKKSQKKKAVVEAVIVDKESNAVSASKSTKSRASNSAIEVQRAKIQDLQLPASISGPGTVSLLNSKGKTRNAGPNQCLSTPTKPTLNEAQFEKETKSSISADGKSTMKKSRKKEAPIEPLETNSTQDQALGSDVMAATRAAVDAILARSSLPSKGSRETPIRSSPLDNVTVPSSSAIPIAPVTSGSPDDQQTPPNNASTTAEQPKTISKCPICDQTPSHVRSRCSIIKAGIRAMRQRITELRQNAPEGNDEERGIIEELQRIIDKRTRRKTPTAGNMSTNIKFTADKSVISPTLVAADSPATQPPKISEATKPAKAPSEEVKSMPLPHLSESLAFSDVSSYTVQDLEALIRGPNITLADVPSSDSNNDEEEVLEEEPEEVQDTSFRSQGRIRYPSSSEEEEEEEEEEASPFVPSIIPLPIKSASELLNEDESSRSGDFRGDITSFHEVNDLGISFGVDKTGDAAVNDAYALDFAHLSVPELSESGRKVVIDGHFLSALDESQVFEESEPPVTMVILQSDPIEPFEKPESSQSPIVSIKDDIDPLQSTPKAKVAVRTRSQRNNSTLVGKTIDLNPKSHSTYQTGFNGVNSTNNNFKSANKTGGLRRITDLPIPVNPAIRVIEPAGIQTRRQAARVEEGKEKVDGQGLMDGSQTKQKNGKLSASKTSPKTPAKIAKTPAKAPIPSNGETIETKSVAAVQNVLETMESAFSHGEQSLASWAVLQGYSQPENKTPGMVDELHSSSDTPDYAPSARKPASLEVVNGVYKKADPLFLHSESQQSFPYSQYPRFTQEPPGSEDEEDEVEASVVKPQIATKSSSKFRSLTEIASQPTLFTPTLRLAQTISAKEVMNLYGSVSKEESEDSDTESDSEAETEAQTSHIPMSRRAGINSVSKRG